jgi:phenylpropionate dioxygenase-like ring-hydroxylating dioxygenase large terminal subunit
MEVHNESAPLNACWHPVARSVDVKVEPVRVELLGNAYVLARLGGGVSAFEDRCPHRHARLSDGAVRDGGLMCRYHGWEFDDAGTCRLIPALGPAATIPKRACLTPLAVTERYDLVWLAPEPPSTDIIEISEWADPTLKPVWMEPVDITAGAAQFIDNFLDFAHFPFVHAGTFGNAESPLLQDFTVEKHHGGLVVNYEHTITNHEDPMVATGEHPLVQPRIMRYEYTVPFSALLRLELPTTNMLNAIAVFCQPVRRGLTRLYTVMLRNDCPDHATAQAAVDYEMTVLAEDLRVLDHLPSDTLALDPTAQIHTRADRLTLEFRRLLRELLTAPGSPDASV